VRTLREALVKTRKHQKKRLAEQHEEAAATPDEEAAPQEETTVTPDEALVADASEDAATDNDEQPSHARKRARVFFKVLGITLGALLTTLLMIWLAGCLLFALCFYPRTNMGAPDVSWMTRGRAAAVLRKAAADYQLKAEGKGLSIELSAPDVGLDLDATASVRNARARVAVWDWPYQILQEHDLSAAIAASCDEARVSKIVQDQVQVFNKDATRPTDATIQFSATARAFQIKPEQSGTALDQGKVEDTVKAAVVTLRPRARITDQQLLQPRVFAADKRLESARGDANVLIRTNLTLKMKESVVATLGPAEIAPWVKLSSDLKVSLDDTAFSDWIEKIVASCNTVGTERTYTRLDGKVVTVSGGTYGWEIDDDAFRTSIRQSMAAGQIGVFEMPVLQEGSGFEGIGKRDWGKRYCDIDLSEQYARFYDDTGACIWESPIVSGSPSKPTPTGVYQIGPGMDSPSILVGEPLPGKKKPEYRTEVAYWMPFVGAAVGLHDATWQSSFGGDRYRTGFGSHGCVNLPLDKARELYSLIKIGDPVVSHD